MGIDLIYCAGSSKPKCCIAVALGYLYGIRSDCMPCTHRIDFVDFNWKSGDWVKHLNMVRTHKPKYAVAPDIENVANLDDILKKAAELAQYADNVIVVPKMDVISSIPREYVIGYSVPTTYSGAKYDIKKLSGRRVHLLGGNPQTQYKCYLRLKDEVISIDGNSYQRAAKWGIYWDLDRMSWVRSTYKGPNHYIHHFTRSAMNVYQFWQMVQSGAIKERQAELGI